MIYMVLLIVFLLILAGCFKGKSDALTDTDIKKQEWKNKYNLSKFRDKHWWYFKLYTPKLPEKFPFSSTILVFLTDRWHLAQLIMLRCFYLIISILISANIITMLILTFIIFPIIVGVSFEVSYSFYLKKYKQ